MQKSDKTFSFYIKLFFSTLFMSAFTVGGGYVMIPLLRRQFVLRYHWLEDEEMMNMAAIAGSSPGAIAVNVLILIGQRLAGVPGIVVTVVATILPPFIILSVISFFYSSFQDNELVRAILWGMQASVGAAITDVVISMSSELFSKKQIVPIVVMILAFIAVAVFGINVILIIIICGAIGAATSIYREKKGSCEHTSPLT